MFYLHLDGQWGVWSAWGTCSVTCGGGTQSRTRVCDSPPPSGGGANCVGSSSENGNCNTQICIPGGLKRQVCPNFGIKHFRLGIIRQPKGQKLNGVLKSHLKYFTLPCPKHGRVCTPSKTQNNIFVVIFFFTAFVSMIAGCYFQKASDFLTN